MLLIGVVRGKKRIIGEGGEVGEIGRSSITESFPYFIYVVAIILYLDC